MNIIPHIEQVVRKHQQLVVGNFADKDGNIYTEDTFVAWAQEEAENLRKVYFQVSGDPYTLDIRKLCYLVKFVPSMTISARRLVSAWPRRHFKNWIKDKDRIGVCALGSGPGSDLFGVLYGLNNKIEDWGKKIQYVVRRETVPTWEHFYQMLKKELRDDEIANIVDGDNETLAETLRYCYDEWIGDDSDNWAQACSYSMCDIVTLQHVLSDPSRDSKDTNHFNRVSGNLLEILKFIKKPAIVLVSDRGGSHLYNRILKLREKVEEHFDVEDVLELTETAKEHIGMSYPDYLTQFQFQATYYHNQTIWEIKEKE